MKSQSLVDVFEHGVRRCLPALATMGAGSCEAADLLVGEAAAQRLRALVEDSTPEDYHGVWLSAPAVAFLALFSRRSALWLTERFTSRHAERVDALVKRDSQGAAEIANIVVNAFATPLAEAQERDILLSAPEVMLDSRRELLTRALSRRPAFADLRPSGYIRLLNGNKRVEIVVAVFLSSESAASFR